MKFIIHSSNCSGFNPLDKNRWFYFNDRYDIIFVQYTAHKKKLKSDISKDKIYIFITRILM